MNSILICGQLELVCCSVRNARYTALLQRGVRHDALAREHKEILLDERHGYVYNEAVMEPSEYHYDKRIVSIRRLKLDFERGMILYSLRYIIDRRTGLSILCYGISDDKCIFTTLL